MIHSGVRSNELLHDPEVGLSVLKIVLEVRFGPEMVGTQFGHFFFSF